MRFLVIGATGRTGRLITAAALAQGHTVTALVRGDPSSSALSALSAQAAGLDFIRGSPLEPADLDQIFSPFHQQQTDAVIVALRLNTTSSSPFAALLPDTPRDLGERSVRNILAAMRRNSRSSGGGTRKIVVMSSQGVGSSWAPLSVLHKMLFGWSNMRHQLADHNAVDKLVRAAAAAAESGDVDFVLVRPVMLAEGEEAPVRDLGDEGREAGFMPKISAKSVARFIVDAAAGGDFDGRSPVIAN